MTQATPMRPADLPDIDPRFLAAHGIMPLGIEDDRLVVSMADPDDAATIAALEFAARRPVIVRAGAMPPVARSLLDRVGEVMGDRSLARWVQVDTLARLVAAGATPAAALARLRAEGGVVSAIDWAGPVEGLAHPGAVARELRVELDYALAVRRASIGPGLVLVVAMLVVGWWGLALGVALIGFRGVPAAFSVARRTGRAAALGMAIDPAGLTVAERDMPAGAAEAVWDRARLMLAAASAQVMSAMLLMLALIAVVRLG